MWLISVVDPEEREAFVSSLMGEESLMALEIKHEQRLPPQKELVQLDMKPPASQADIEETMKEIDPKDIKIEETPEYTKITLRSDSFFESGRATISNKTRETLEVLVETLSGRNQPITVTGFTDNRPINNFQFPSNWELSAARAATVTRTFIDMGMNKQLLTIEGKGDNEEVTSNETAYGRSLNRRVIIMVDKRPESAIEPR